MDDSLESRLRRLLSNASEVLMADATKLCEEEPLMAVPSLIIAAARAAALSGSSLGTSVEVFIKHYQRWEAQGKINSLIDEDLLPDSIMN